MSIAFPLNWRNTETRIHSSAIADRDGQLAARVLNSSIHPIWPADTAALIRTPRRVEPDATLLATTLAQRNS